MLSDLDRNFLDQKIDYDIYDARYKEEIPGLDYDIYISTGGPGSPLDGVGSSWEKDYFKFLDSVWSHNQKDRLDKKHIFFICHSFQLACRYFDFVEVSKRASMSFGITFVHKTEDGMKEPCFQPLADPFYVADFRDWQALNPDMNKMDELGAKILTMEKERPHLDYEQAVTSIRISPEMLATQFHPEADARGMLLHFQKPEKRDHIIKHHGEEKFHSIIRHLKDPDKINFTHQTIIPSFLENAIYQLKDVEKPEELVEVR